MSSRKILSFDLVRGLVLKPRGGRACLSFAILAWMAGCASEPAGLRLDPVGPGIVRGSTSRGWGGLIVYSSIERRMSGDFVFQPHSAYWIFTPEGRQIRAIQNHTAITDERPTKVRLAAGEYLVVARAEGYGLVRVPVLIAADQETELRLDGASLREARSAEASAVVTLPGGPVIGWRSPGRTTVHPADPNSSPESPIAK